MLSLLLASATWAAPIVPFAGVEFVPLSRSDLTWVAEERGTGRFVGEFDGAVRPNLQAFGGLWIGDYVGFSMGFGVARITTTRSDGEDTAQQHWGVFRPSLDARFTWMKRKLHRPVLWGFLGGYGDIPSVRNLSTDYTDEEAEAASASVQSERWLLGGAGGRTGAGIDYRLLPNLAIGASFGVELHWGVLRSEEISNTSTWVGTRASLLLTFEWDKANSPK